MDFYPRAAMERAMKVQDVMLQAMAKKITWWQAAEILGISDRHMRRWRERYVEEGYDRLFDRRRGQPSRRRVPVASVEKVFAHPRFADYTSKRIASGSPTIRKEPHPCRNLCVISTRTFLVSAALLTSSKNAMRAPRIPSWVFSRT